MLFNVHKANCILFLVFFLFSNKDLLSQVSVQASVFQNGDTLEYQYSLQNQNEINKIEELAVSYSADLMYAHIPSPLLSPTGWMGACMTDTLIFFWGSIDDANDILPGANLSGFTLISFGLPHIADYYSWYYAEPEEGEPEEDEDLTIFSNAIVGKTIAPKVIFSPFDGLLFLDTIKIYVNQSLILGWITNQSTANKYITLYDTVHTLIERGNGRAARQTLDAVLFDVELDKNNTLTNEAYALMRFNTEYLKNHLPTTTLDIPVENQWNLVSVPVEITDFTKASIYPTAQSDAFGYNNGYIVKDTLTLGKGYWIKFGAAHNVSYTGLAIDTLQVPIDTAWNIVGSISINIPVSRVVTMPSSLITTPFYEFSNGAYYPADTLKAGKGYWVKMDDEGTLVYGLDTSFGSQPPGEVPPPIGAPSAPILIMPANGAVNQSSALNVSWHSSVNAETYRLQIALDSNFSTIIYNQWNFVDSMRYVGSLSFNTTYYWRVNATNSSGTSAWSSIWKFTTQSPPSAPSAPILAYPNNNAINVSITPSVSWNASSGASSYRVQVATSSSFTTLVFDQNNVTVTSMEVGTLAYATTYYWRVNASNPHGTSSWSSIRHFMTESSESPCVQYSSLQSLDELTVSDASGKSQRLFIQNGKRALPRGFPNVNMPPEPPPGVFTTRFQSGKFIEKIRPNMPARRIPVTIRDAQAPFVLTWDIKNENKIQYWLIVPGRTEQRISLKGRGSREIARKKAGSIIIEAQSVDPCEPE